MAMKAGVWIDHRQAVVVLVTDAGKAIKKIASGVEKPIRSSGHPSSKHKYTPNDFVAEDKLQRKLRSQLKKYFDEILACVHDAEAILIVGPGEAKGEFVKRLKSKEHRGRIAELETTDKMTDRELAAKVGEHFATSTAKSGKPKRKAKVTKSTSGYARRNRAGSL